MTCAEKSSIADRVGGYRDDLSIATLDKPKHPGGRPTVASLSDPAVVQELCERIASGRSVAEVCRDPDMPDAKTVWLWNLKSPEFSHALSRAREAQQDVNVETIQHIADNATPEDWQVARLRIQARQWQASKLSPRKYGDSVAVTGANGGPIEVARVDDGELARMVALLLAQAGTAPMIEAHGSEAQVTDIAGEETPETPESG